MKKTVILDTNFLLIPGVWGVDIFAEIQRICDYPYRLCIVEPTRKELENITGKGKNKAAAKLAQSLLDIYGVETIPGVGHVDDLIVKESKKAGIIVATQDQALKKRLKHIPIIILRKKQYLTMREPDVL